MESLEKSLLELDIIFDEIQKSLKEEKEEKFGLGSSKYSLFPLEYAEVIKNKYPKVWKMGGNIQGNDTYRVVKGIRDGNKSADELSSGEVRILKMREAWCARHFKDKNIRGVIAQVKWHMVGSRGLSHMKSVIREEIKKKYSE